MAALSGFFGALAALLATIGIYGVIAYVVARRQSEIGIRMALGSTRPQVIGLVRKESAVLVVVGLAIGLAGSVALARSPLLRTRCPRPAYVLPRLAAARPGRRPRQLSARVPRLSRGPDDRAAL
jgi:hypothetical protein